MFKGKTVYCISLILMTMNCSISHFLSHCYAVNQGVSQEAYLV
ncbi:hypothetical protein PNI0076_00911 [Streptococcus pneumoniae PNI0076]|nr:hypothetical protein PCS125219_00201 [Streptococcus pneumoniae PCS125219]ELU65311.1 hypothetical protein PNI0002_01033 [Streptococcus pneumoniae PNI0002]ELU75707.1 hypothetical protein PNI0007_00072 [Streptococcus pneumoniae PNI0007]ELU78547.1 hypothetical protein PNI0153_02086 [Streptococcus pneumoniae PNI0153]ELU84070.1 hypothetical protein PNI0076_00911 [Streptococcus pneumoniae PNI0076]ELU93814.1 hypothetical protein PNI0446_00070 [Streptococcus pneumoniae PNI0446]EMY86333.1 hypothetic